MSTETLNLTPRLYEYFQKTSLREPSVLQKLRKETQQMVGSVMQISPEQGQLMMLLLELLGARKTLDVGTFTGYSALVAALALPADGKVVTCDISAANMAIAQRYFEEAGMTNKMIVKLGPAIQTLESLLAEGEASSYDFAFIDADKTNYDDYYELSLRLLRRGGLIAIDNVLWSGQVADPSVHDTNTNALRALNTKLLKDNRVTLSMIPIGDGLTLARKR